LVLAFTVVAYVGYLVGERTGRGRGCLSSALAWRGPTGASIAEAVLSKPGSRVDYTCWGAHCSISAAFPNGSEWVGGRWAYVPERDLLFAVEPSGARLVPGIESWGDYVVGNAN